MNNLFGESIKNNLGLVNFSSMSFVVQECYECNRCRKLLIFGRYEISDRMKFQEYNMFGKEYIYNFVQYDLI